MGNDPQFPFTFLQQSGPGTNALTVPSLSSFCWTAKDVVRMAGQGCLYIQPEIELILPEEEEVVDLS